MLAYLVESLNVAAALYLAMAVYALTRPPSIINRLLFLILLACTVWALTYHGELTARDLHTKLVWMKGRFAFLSFLTVLWFMLSAKLAGAAQRVTPGMWAMLFIVPVLTLLNALTMDYHSWFRHGFSIAPGTGFRPLLFERGPWCLVYDVYQLALQAVGLLLLFRALRTLPPTLRKPIAFLIFSSLLPIVCNSFFNANAQAIQGFNPAPLTLLPAASAMAVSVFRFQLLDVVPIARDMLFDHIRDGIIVTDLAGRVVDLNTAAENMLSRRHSEILGRDCSSTPQPWPQTLVTDGPLNQAFCSDSDRDGPWYQRTRIPILIDGKHRGWMFLCQDITAQMLIHRQRINRVRHEEEDKRARQWALLLRDLHDGIGAVSANIGLLAELGRKAPAEAKDAVFTQIGDLAKEGNIEVRTIMNSLETRNLTWSALFAELRHYATLVLEPRNIRFALTVDGEPGDDPDFAASASLFRIVKEALANAAKHAQATEVTVLFHFSPERLLLEVSDNGRWKEKRAEGRGLRHLRQRVQDLGGTFTLKTAPATQLTCLLTLPFAAPADDPLSQPRSAPS